VFVPLTLIELVFYHARVRSAEIQRGYNVQYYATHRQAELERVKRRQQATLAFLRDLRRVPCDDCREMFPPHMMDFDHRDPNKKLFTIAGLTLSSCRATG
jgi:hypothetical protein